MLFILFLPNLALIIFSPVPYASQAWSVGVEEQLTQPDNYSLFQNYPNPFNPVTISIDQSPESRLVTLKVFNTLGQEVAEKFDIKKRGFIFWSTPSIAQPCQRGFCFLWG